MATVTLLDNPRQQFRLFYRAAVAAYGAACTTVYLHGLLGYIVNNNQWELLPGNNVIDPDPNVTNAILPRPSRFFSVINKGMSSNPILSRATRTDCCQQRRVLKATQIVQTNKLKYRY